jgi:branched-chain amino acid transport system ATP-binding protein
MLEATGLMVFYENMLALNNVSIQCRKNQIVGVFGANSAGKSTLMYTLSGIMEDIRKKEDMAGGERITVIGKVVYMGEDISKLKPSRRARKGMVLCPERRRIFTESNVMENLRIGGYLATPSQAKKTLEYVFKVFPALEKLKKRIGGFLSGGEQQMLAISRAIMARPRLLLMDEPSLGLAPLVVKQIFSIIRKINEEQKTTIFLVEQNANLALKTAHRGYVMENGRITLSDSAENLLKNDDVKKAYLGM